MSKLQHVYCQSKKCDNMVERTGYIIMMMRPGIISITKYILCNIELKFFSAYVDVYVANMNKEYLHFMYMRTKQECYS